MKYMIKYASFFLFLLYAVNLFRVLQSGGTLTLSDAVLSIVLIILNLSWFVICSILYLEKKSLENKKILRLMLLFKVIIFLLFQGFINFENFRSSDVIYILFIIATWIISISFLMLDQWVYRRYVVNLSFPSKEQAESNWHKKKSGKILLITTFIYFVLVFNEKINTLFMILGLLLIIVELAVVYVGIYKGKRK